MGLPRGALVGALDGQHQYIYIYINIHKKKKQYMYTYIYRERERERSTGGTWKMPHIDGSMPLNALTRNVPEKVKALPTNAATD